MAAAAIPAVLAIAGAYMEHKAAGKQRKAVEGVAQNQEAAAEQAQRIANQNAANVEAETAEQVRRTEATNAAASAERVARMAASGGTASGSSQNFLDTQDARQKNDIDWLKQSGSSKANIAREEGRYANLTGKATASGTRASTAGSKTAGLGKLIGAGGSAFSGLYNPAGTTPGLDMNSIWT